MKGKSSSRLSSTYVANTRELRGNPSPPSHHRGGGIKPPKAKKKNVPNPENPTSTPNSLPPASTVPASQWANRPKTSAMRTTASPKNKAGVPGALSNSSSSTKVRHVFPCPNPVTHTANVPRIQSIRQRLPRSRPLRRARLLVPSAVAGAHQKRAIRAQVMARRRSAPPALHALRAPGIHDARRHVGRRGRHCRAARGLPAQGRRQDRGD